MELSEVVQNEIRRGGMTERDELMLDWPSTLSI